jgi:hypothetical protein
MAKRRKFSDEFKHEAARLATQPGVSGGAMRVVHPRPAYSGGLQASSSQLKKSCSYMNWLLILGFRA